MFDWLKTNRSPAQRPLDGPVPLLDAVPFGSRLRILAPGSVVPAIKGSNFALRSRIGVLLKRGLLRCVLTHLRFQTIKHIQGRVTEEPAEGMHQTRCITRQPVRITLLLDSKCVTTFETNRPPCLCEYGLHLLHVLCTSNSSDDSGLRHHMR
jgi:hypothetical protein